MPNVESDAEQKAKANAKWWQEEWLKFPTVSLDEEGTWRYWDVPADDGVYSEGRSLGEALARDTVAQMQHFPEGSSVLRRIMRDIDHNSIAAQGFFNRLEDMLTRPDIYLDSLEPGSVRAKLRGVR